MKEIRVREWERRRRRRRVFHLKLTSISTPTNHTQFTTSWFLFIWSIEEITWEIFFLTFRFEPNSIRVLKFLNYWREPEIILSDSRTPKKNLYQISNPLEDPLKPLSRQSNQEKQVYVAPQRLRLFL